MSIFKYLISYLLTRNKAKYRKIAKSNECNVLKVYFIAKGRKVHLFDSKSANIIDDLIQFGIVKGHRMR